MSRKRLIEAFAGQTILPVDLNKVRQWLLDNRIQDEINFIPVKLDVGVIRGFLKRVRHHKGGWDIDPDDVSNIYYDHQQAAEWQNLVCGKELLHILDGACVSTKEQFEKLTHRLSLPSEMRHLLEDPDYALVDKFGAACACALLLPLAARDVLKPAYDAEVITEDDIARQAVIPVEYVRTVMSDNWPDIYRVVLQQRPQDDVPYPQAEVLRQRRVRGAMRRR